MSQTWYPKGLASATTHRVNTAWSRDGQYLRGIEYVMNATPTTLYDVNAQNRLRIVNTAYKCEAKEIFLG
jgi:hypothetical protein